MELSSLIGKRIVSPVGEVQGYVMRACPTRDLKKLSSLVCVDSEEEEYYLPARAVTAIGDAVVAGKARLSTPTGIHFPVGMPAYSEHGALLGVVSDFLLGEAPAIVISKIIITNDGARAVYPAECVQIGDTVIVYSSPVKRVSVKKHRPAHRKKAEPAEAAAETPASAQATPVQPAKVQTSFEPPASAQPAPIEAAPDLYYAPPVYEPAAPVQRNPAPPASPVPAQPAPVELAPAQSTSTQPAPVPSTAEPYEQQSPTIVHSLNRLNLLGRRVKKSVFDSSGAPIVRAGERITADTLSAARKENKLLQLTVNTLTNLV